MDKTPKSQKKTGKKRKKRRRFLSPLTIVKHHTQYEPEEKFEFVYHSEHNSMTWIDRRTKNVSGGYLRCMQAFIDRSWPIAVELKERYLAEKNGH